MNSHLYIKQQDKGVVPKNGFNRLVTLFFCNKSCRTIWKSGVDYTQPISYLLPNSIELSISKYYRQRCQTKLQAQFLMDQLAEDIKRRDSWKLWSNTVLSRSSYSLTKDEIHEEQIDKALVQLLETLINVIDRSRDTQDLTPERVTPHDLNASCDHCSQFNDSC